MIQIALYIAAALFLGWFTIAVLGLIAEQGWQLALLAILAFVALVIFFPDRPAETPTRAQTLSSMTLPERLRANPPVILQLEDGEAWLVSALESDSKQFRILVRFTATDSTKSLLGGKARRALALLNPPLCGPEGLLARYHLPPGSISIISYENGVRVGERQLLSTYCSPKPA